MKTKWQHVIPQGDYRQAGPAPHRIVPKGKKCEACGFTIKRVPEDDGPEGLKALFRF